MLFQVQLRFLSVWLFAHVWDLNADIPFLSLQKKLDISSGCVVEQLGPYGCRVKPAFGELQFKVAQTQLQWMMLVIFPQAQT